jgi:hypothetical protein
VEARRAPCPEHSAARALLPVGYRAIDGSRNRENTEYASLKQGPLHYRARPKDGFPRSARRAAPPAREALEIEAEQVVDDGDGGPEAADRSP